MRNNGECFDINGPEHVVDTEPASECDLRIAESLLKAAHILAGGLVEPLVEHRQHRDVSDSH